MATYFNGATTAMPGTPTNASFQAWIAQFKTALLAGGWAQTSDTGQVDETTVLAPTVVSTWAGFHLYYLNDAYHATAPLIMKVTWGVGTAITRLSWKIQFGYATNGAGVFTGWSSAEFQLGLGSSGTYDTGSAVPGTFLASGGAGYGFFAAQYAVSATAANRPFFLLQRRPNPDGSIASGGDWSLLWSPTGAGPTISGLFTAQRSTSLTLASNLYFCMPVAGATLSTGGDTEVYQHYGRFGNLSAQTAGCASATYMASEITTDATFNLNVYGSTRTWRATGRQGVSVTSSASHALAVVWE